MKFFLLILQLSILIGMYSCKKDTPPVDNTPQLPPETQTGENTFGCLVNGQVWLPKGGGLIQTVQLEFTPPVLIINAHKAVEDETIKINLTNLNSIGAYVLNDSSNYQIVYYRKSSSIFYCDSIISGNLTMTKIDTLNKILSGTFFFDAVNDTIRYHIRSGRFDLKY